ncbi:MAG: 23S rRNA (guanosine(2251)-2'-O)-methyltransferase RlmB [Clostridia bacterium]|jgi:23S rRNA (guanosine2251-2'-O)-methyltransferase|nr:23S rRNA (guanosine(2251)-2'-O)-methyltransferase RlmB [Clostridia bacterium]
MEQSLSGERRAASDCIIGRNAVLEALRSGRSLDSVWIAKGERNGSIGVVRALCRENGIPIKETDIHKLNSLGGNNHQGVMAFAACKEYASMEDVFEKAEASGQPPFIIVCDELEDAHNLGAVLRSAEAAGCHGVIIPKRRAVGLTSTVYKTSAGAVEYVPVVRVANITDTLKQLKKKGLWVYGLDMDGTSWCQTDLTGPIVLVVGSEGHGMSRLVKEQCDGIVSLPMQGHINSLNASVAGGIMMYEVVRQRLNLQK